ncbi:MAG: pyridoxine 5'-phosphate synthase [Deltaproteobacteria bacterium]|nr:pyridoxine 5'-phosphate synthase [Deltaproteobacteria bacterium]
MARLSVNVDHVATLRQARMALEPDPVAAAVLAELGGAQGITVHLREDRRHIQERDLEILRRTVKTRLTLEMAAVEEIIAIALRILPDMVTLVPEKRHELTTEGGLDVMAHENELKGVIERLQKGGIPVSLFIDPVPRQIEAAARVGVDAIEIHTGLYSDAAGGEQRDSEFRKVAAMASLGERLGLVVHAGHGLDYRNAARVAALPEISEISIGHSIIARAVLVGFERAVREMADIFHRCQTG